MRNHPARPHLLLSIPACLLLGGLLGGCGGNRAPTTPAPATGELERTLFAELQRLGKDTAAAGAVLTPSGTANTPCDLRLEPAGGTQVRLRWTEQLLGDYDQNGLVSISDLTPLSGSYGRAVDYLPGPHSLGALRVPVGSPFDGGVAGPRPAAGSGADNWRLARIGGNGDGLLLIHDIGPGRALERGPRRLPGLPQGSR